MVDDRKYIAISCMLAESHSETDGCIRIFCFYVSEDWCQTLTVS